MKKTMLWISGAVVLAFVVFVSAQVLFSGPGGGPRPGVVVDPPIGPTTEPPPPPPPPPPPELPKIDVIILDVKVPSHVKHGKNFDLVVVLRNGSQSKVAKNVTVFVRAGLQPGNNPNVAVAERFFTQLSPGAEKRQKIPATAPFKAGVWVLRAEVKSKDYIDNANNFRDVPLIVD